MKTGSFHFAVLGLVSTRERGVHGYQLRNEVRALCDDFWQVNFGKIYGALDALEKSGDVQCQGEVQANRPARKVYRITEKGRRSLDDWLIQPPSTEPSPLRDELAIKLLFLNASDIDQIRPLIRQQRSIYLQKLGELTRRRRQLERARVDARILPLVMDGAELRLKADLSWLEHLERKLLQMF
jgi:DNA-binding PadR family transcriptional regulator